MAKEYIEREAALNAVDARIEQLKRDAVFSKKGMSGVIDVGGVKNHLLSIPAADAVEVVRCRNCLRWKKDGYGGVCGRYGVRLDKDWFCAGGERREVQDV